MRLTFGKGDILAITIVATLAMIAAVGFSMGISSDGQKVVRVYQDGELLESFPLEEDREMLVQGKYTNKVVVRDGQAAITESDCPGTDCVYSGWIAETGGSIVCLPNRVEVRIHGTESDVDIIIR